MNETFLPEHAVPVSIGTAILNNLEMKLQNNYRAEVVRCDQFIDIFDGTDLFSRFTADIMNLRVVFTR
jgi:hypothetical protein